MGKGETAHQLHPESCTDTLLDLNDIKTVMPSSSSSVTFTSTRSRLTSRVNQCLVVSSPNMLTSSTMRKSFIVPSSTTVIPSAENAAPIPPVFSGFSERNLPLVSGASDTLILSDEDVYYTTLAYNTTKTLVLGDDLPNEPAKTRSDIRAVLRSKNGRIGRQCPGGRSSTGGGTTTSSGWAQSGVSATGADSGGSVVTGLGYGGTGGSTGDDDDDPWKQNRPVNLRPGHYADFPDIPVFDPGDSFDPYKYLPTDEQVLFRDALVVPLESDQSSSFNLDVTSSFQLPKNGDISDSSFPDAAPATPMSLLPPTPRSVLPPTPMSVMPPTPGTPSTGHLHHPIPVSTPVSDNSSDINDLFEINRMMRIPNQTAPVAKATQPVVSYQSFTAPQPQPLVRRPVPVQESPSCDPIPEEFFRYNTFCNSGKRFVEVTVNSQLPAATKSTAFQALTHFRNLCESYDTQFKQEYNLRVAMPTKAHICDFNFNYQEKKLVFVLPEGCVRIEEWLEQNPSCDIRDCQLILQQVINTLATLYQSRDTTLTLFGGYQVWVARNMQVYLCIDCTASLVAQKKYAFLPQLPPRTEDIIVLSRLYETVLRPFIVKELNWVSQMLSRVFEQFQQLLSNPVRCTNQMAQVASLLGGCRICKLTIQLTDQNLLGRPCMVYCLEQETIGDVLQTIKPMLPPLSNLWFVCWKSRCSDRCTQVAAQAKAVATNHNQLILLPCFHGVAECTLDMLYLFTHPTN